MADAVEAASLKDLLYDAGDTIIEIGTLKFIFGGYADNKLVGFLRIVIGILIFTLIYLGLSVWGDKIPKKIAITISILLSIMTSIFIPASVLISIAVTYGIIFSFIFYGALIVPGILLVFKTPTDTRPQALFKLVLLGLMGLVIGQVTSAAKAVMGGAPFGLGAQITDIGEFTVWAEGIRTYAYLVFVVIGAYLVFKLIFPTGSGEKAWGVGKVGAEKVKGFSGKVVDKITGKAKKSAKREKTKLLDEYIEEKKELELVEEAIHNAEKFDADVKDFTQGKLNLTDLRDGFKDLKNTVEKAGKETGRLTSRTFRQERQYNTLRKALQKAEVEIPSKEKNAMETYEQDLLYQHRLVLDSMRKSAASLNKIDTELKKSKNQVNAKQLSEASAIVHRELGQAYAAQEQAYKEATNLISYFEKYWK